MPGHIPTVNRTYNDLLNRTLSKISCDLARLIYLASTRDYNSGAYHHEGLSFRHGANEAREALQTAHREVFCRLVACSLEELVDQLDLYIRSCHEAPGDVLDAWQKLEPYRVAMPMDVNPTMVELLLSNIKVALRVLHFRQDSIPTHLLTASPRPSLVR